MSIIVNRDATTRREVVETFNTALAHNTLVRCWIVPEADRISWVCFRDDNGNITHLTYKPAVSTS